MDVCRYNFGYAAVDSNPVGGSRSGHSRGLFVVGLGLSLMSGGVEPPHEVWDVLSQAHG